MLDLLYNKSKWAIKNMFKELKEVISNELKERMIWHVIELRISEQR